MTMLDDMRDASALVADLTRNRSERDGRRDLAKKHLHGINMAFLHGADETAISNAEAFIRLLKGLRPKRTKYDQGDFD